MATFTVSTTADVVNPNDGVLSLREAVNQANATAAADTIVFASKLEGQTLTLAGGELVLRRDVIIDGDQNNDGIEVVLSGGDAQRILRTSGTGTDVALRDLSLENGQVGNGADGGAVFVGGGGLDVQSCTVRDSASGGYGGDGGGIYADTGSRVVIKGSSFISNSMGLYGYGGAIAGNNVDLVIRDTVMSGNVGGGGGGAIFLNDSVLTTEDCVIYGNGRVGLDALTNGGGIFLIESSAVISRTSIHDNVANFGGGISGSSSFVIVSDSTIANNTAQHDGFYNPAGGGIRAGDNTTMVVRNSVITGNLAESIDTNGPEYYAKGGGIFVDTTGNLDIANSMVVGNTVRASNGNAYGAEIYGTVSSSDGHNIFGFDTASNPAGDRVDIAASAVFAAIDPTTGGGLLNASGVVSLRSSLDNPALSGADLLAAGVTDQLGAGRPLPAGSLPDIGPVEINRAPSSTASPNNDVITDGSAGHTINALAGADYIKGMGGADALHGGDGGDLLDGGPGNDKLYGDAGIDFVFYGGSAKVTVDLSLATDKATRGTETDALHEVEGAIGSSANDSFKGDGNANWFQGGLGKDTATGGGGRDLYDFNAVSESAAGSNRDVITDFAHLADKIDLMGIDANTAIARDQAFHWVGTAPLNGPGEVGFHVTSAGNTIIRASNDVDGASEFEALLNGTVTLTALDFYM